MKRFSKSKNLRFEDQILTLPYFVTEICIGKLSCILNADVITILQN